MTDIFARIRSAASGSPPSAEIAETLRQVRSAVSDEKAWRASFEATAVNPLVDTSEAHRAQEEITESHLNERRLLAAIAILEPKFTETAEAERQAALIEAYDAAKAERDAFVVSFRRTYPKHANAIIGLMQQMVEIETRIAEVKTPAGRERLSDLDEILNVDPTRPIAHHLRLPFVTMTDAQHWDAEADAAAARRASEQRERASAFAAIVMPERRRA